MAEEQKRYGTLSGGPRTERAHVLEKLYRSHAADLIGWLRRRFGDGPPDPQDIAQAAFTRLMGLKSIQDIADKRAFLFTVAANVALSGLKWRQRKQAFIERQLADHGLDIENITPERVHLSREKFVRLEALLQSMPVRQRDIVIRSRIHGQTYMEISAITGWSLGTIASEMKAAMKMLEQLNRDGERELPNED